MTWLSVARWLGKYAGADEFANRLHYNLRLRLAKVLCGFACGSIHIGGQAKRSEGRSFLHTARRYHGAIRLSSVCYTPVKRW